MNLRKVAVVSILCVVVAISAFLIYRFRMPEDVEITSVVAGQYIGIYHDPSLYATIIVPITVGMKNNLDSDVTVTLKVVAKSASAQLEKSENALVLMKAHSYENTTINMTVPSMPQDLKVSAQILKVSKNFTPNAPNVFFCLTVHETPVSRYMKQTAKNLSMIS
jgi:hypothetical protein